MSFIFFKKKTLPSSKKNYKKINKKSIFFKKINIKLPSSQNM